MSGLGFHSEGFVGHHGDYFWIEAANRYYFLLLSSISIWPF